MKFFIIFAVVVASGNTANPPCNPPEGQYKVYGNYYAWNNGWNDPNKVIKAQYGQGTSPEMTVSFNFHDHGCFGYPAICRGWHHNVNPTTYDKLFPRQVQSIKSIPVTFSYSAQGKNVGGDFAYDIFFRRDTNKDTPELEVMIWGDHNSWPLGKQSGSNVIRAGGRSFDLWEGWNGDAGYYVYSFVPHGSVGKSHLASSGSLNLNIKPFLNWLRDNRAHDGHYDHRMYLHVIEAGFEVAKGNGSVHFKATINAH